MRRTAEADFRAAGDAGFDSNDRALCAYRRLGFTEEGRLREKSCVQGRYVDEVVMGLQRCEWEAGKAKETR